MVQTLAEPLDAEVIKVTIKDKPGPRKPQPEELLRVCFEVLRLYALQERRVRQLGKLIAARRTLRQVHRCFGAWRQLASASTAARRATGSSGDVKIELLVNALAEKQREILAAKTESKASAPARPSPQPAPAVTGKPPAVLPRSALEAKKRNVEAARERRAKLAEQRQQQEEKLREIDETARRSSKKTMEVAKQAMAQCDQRTRRGIIHLMREQGCRDKSLMEMPRVPSPPRFLMRMEARAEARKQRMKQTDDVRRRRREEQKKRDEMSRLQAEEAQRQQQIKAQKEAQRVRKEQELKRLREIEKNRRLEQLADQCYNRYLFRRYILEPLAAVVEEKRQVLQSADKHYEMTLMWKVFSAWKTEWTEQLSSKLQLARKLYRHNLLWYNFDEWRILAVNAKQQHQVAVDFYNMNLQKKCFQRWHLMCDKIRVISHEQEVRAKKHYEKKLKKSCFQIWRKFMLIANDLNESEQRRDEWRDLIRRFIPNTPKLKRASIL